MRKEELKEITGGNLSASVLNALSRGVTTLYNLGVACGSAIRRALKKKIC